MASTALKKITTRAKQIYAKGGTWKVAIKKAGAEYRTGKKKPAAKKRVTKKAPRRKTAKRKVAGVLSSASTLMQTAAIGRLTTPQLISHAKKRIDKTIGELYTKIFLAATKMEKRKLQKRLNAAKSKYKKLATA